MSAMMREFDTGATRNLDASKLDYEGFLSPLVVERFARYMHANRQQADGKLRDSDNWQKGIPPASYMKSGWRHFFDLWKGHRGLPAGEDIETACCALLFNVQGYLHEYLKAKGVHHATEAPMPPHLAELIGRHEGDDAPEESLNFDRPNPISQEDEE